MTEKSQFWYTDGFTGATGDGSAPYTQEEFRAYNQVLLGEGVVAGYANKLAVSGVASPLSVATGRAQVAGFHYWNDAVKTLAVGTPSAGTTGGRVVLRATWATATVRLAILTSGDGVATLPTLTQTAGTLWEVGLASFTITTGGVISLTDTRTFAGTPLATPDGSTLERGATGLLQIKDSGVSEAKIAAGAVSNGKIANDAVDDAKIGYRVPTLTRRQGNDAAQWAANGTTSYTPTSVNMQAGALLGGTSLAAGATEYKTVTFPVAFAAQPLVFVTAIAPSSADVGIVLTIDTPGASYFNINIYNASGVSVDYRIHWLAIGEPA